MDAIEPFVGKHAFNFCGLVHWFLPPIVSRTSNFFYDNGGSLARPSRSLPVSRRRAQITSPGGGGTLRFSLRSREPIGTSGTRRGTHCDVTRSRARCSGGRSLIRIERDIFHRSGPC
jgi:hypothetical protein